MKCRLPFLLGLPLVLAAGPCGEEGESLKLYEKTGDSLPLYPLYRLSLTWGFTRSGTASSCEELGIANVRVQLLRNGRERYASDQPCANGSAMLEFKDPAYPGTQPQYQVNVLALDTGGAELGRADKQVVTMDSQGAASLSVTINIEPEPCDDIYDLTVEVTLRDINGNETDMTLYAEGILGYVWTSNGVLFPTFNTAPDDQSLDLTMNIDRSVVTGPGNYSFTGNGISGDAGGNLFFYSGEILNQTTYLGKYTRVPFDALPGGSFTLVRLEPNCIAGTIDTAMVEGEQEIVGTDSAGNTVTQTVTLEGQVYGDFQTTLDY